jgi:nucleoside-diphosphate-sugar epimerase
LGHHILITGGAGFVGSVLAAFLLRRGCRVRTLDLEPLSEPALVGRVEHVRGDLRDPEILRKSAEGTDVVVHAGAALPLWPVEQIHSINVEGTRGILETCRTLGISRCVLISTTAVYGITDREGTPEDAPLAGADPYSRSKIEAEAIARPYRDKMCVPILRAKLVVGPGRLGIFDVIFDWVSRGKHVPIVGPGNNPYQMLHVEDLSRAIWLAISRPPGIANDTFNIAAERFGTVRQDHQDLLDYAGFGKRIIGLPALPVTWALRVLELLRMSPLSSSIYKAAGTRSSVSIEKAGRVLGWVPRRSNRQALVDAYDWYLENRAEFEGREGVTHKAPLRQGFLSLVRAFF